MTWIADAGLWLAIALTGVVTGVEVSRWRDDRSHAARNDTLLLVAAGAAVVAWCSKAGTLLGASSTEYLQAVVPIAVSPGYRLAVLWSTLSGASLTFATLLLVWGAISGARARTAALVSGLALLTMALSAVVSPKGIPASAIPPFVQSLGAALAPLFSILALATLTVAFAKAFGARMPLSRSMLTVAWLAASAMVVCEQAARSELGIGPRDPIVLGSASSGLVLWLVASALLHRRVQSLVASAPDPVVRTEWSRYSTLTGHVGAGLLAISFAAHAFAARSTIALPPGAAVDVNDAFRRRWQLVNQGVSRFDAEGVDVTALAIEARTASGQDVLMTPEIREYHTSSGDHLPPVSLRRSNGKGTQAVRVLFLEADSLDVASVRVTFLPLPILWPVGVMLIAISGLLSLAAPNSLSKSF